MNTLTDNQMDRLAEYSKAANRQEVEESIRIRPLDYEECRRVVKAFEDKGQIWWRNKKGTV